MLENGVFKKMTTNSARIRELVERPSESLAVEIKRWVDPNEPAGIGKIVRTVLALRNYGGGYLVIGFDDETLEPYEKEMSKEIRAQFHTDVIQGLVSKYASEPFEVAVDFPERGGQEFPVITVPPGVKTPVAAKSDLWESKKKLIACGDLYVRTLRSNNTPSTSKARWKDWPDLIDTCFNNREADIGRFVRRHLGALDPETLQQIGSMLAEAGDPRESWEGAVKRLLDESGKRFDVVVEERGIELPDHGSWETGLILDGDIPDHSADHDFLNLLAANNPHYTGWPVWLDSRQFSDKEARPFVFDGLWEALIVDLARNWSVGSIDFMRLDPRGRFYLRRSLRDDMSRSSNAPRPMTQLDFNLVIYRAAEILAVGLSFGKAMGCDVETTVLNFAMRWKKLKGRYLSAGANRDLFIPRAGEAYQDQVLSFVDVPLETSLSALGDFVHRATQPLLEVFGGFNPGRDVVEELTRKVIERQL